MSIKKVLGYSLYLIISINLLCSACVSKNFQSQDKLKLNESGEKKDNRQQLRLGNNIQPPKVNNEIMSSGATTKVPWENDELFKSTQQKNGTGIMMAAYRTVLKDPLPGEEYNVHLAAKFLAGTVLKPGETFSQNNKIGPYVEAKGFQKGPTYDGAKLVTTVGGGVCKVASKLYNVVVLSNLEVVERHNHSMPVPYVPYGQDATVSFGANDFKFRNNSDSPVLIWAQGVDNILYIGFYSKAASPKVEWHHEISNTQKAPVVYRINTSLPRGSEKKAADGMDGAIVKSWVTVESPDGTKIEKQMLKSIYKPFPNIIEKGG